MKTFFIATVLLSAIGIYIFGKQKPKHPIATGITLQYHYKAGKILSQAKDTSSWELLDKQTDCGGPANLPCIIIFTTNIYPTLQDYLDNFATPVDVKNAAIATRNL